MWYFIVFAIAIIFIVALFASPSNKSVTGLKNIPQGHIRIEDFTVNFDLQSTKDSLVSAIKEHKSLDDINFEAISKSIESVQNNTIYDYLNSLLFIMMTRHTYTNFDGYKERFFKYAGEINMESDEFLLYRNKSASIYTIQKLLTEVTFAGNRVNAGTFRSGNVYVKTRDVEGMRLKDNGKLYLTNKRIIIVCDNSEVVSIGYSNIIDDVLFEDNGIMLKINNSKPIIIGLNKNFLYDIKNAIAFDDRLEAFSIMDSIVHTER